MKSKNLLTIGLLLFVAAAVVTIVWREADNNSSVDAAVEAGVDTPLPANGLVAYYFHSNTRCPTCRTIEADAHEAIQHGFPEKLASGEVEWRVVNYELPPNAHLATDYDIIASSIVLVRSLQGQPAEWRNLDRIWELVGEKDAFMEYVRQQAEEMLSKT